MRKLPETKRSRMQIKTKIFYEKDHFKHPSQPFKDLVRYFDFVNEIKKLKIHVVLQAPPRSFSPFWFHFEDIESWTQNNLHLSYVEFMSLPNRLMKDCLDLNFFFNDPLI